MQITRSLLTFVKALLSRQFVELSKVRIEGLLAAFPKLMGTEKQHTFVETENVLFLFMQTDLIMKDPLCISTNGKLVHIIDHQQSQ